MFEKRDRIIFCKEENFNSNSNSRRKKCIGDCYRECAHIKKHFEYVICADDCIKKNCKKNE